MDEGTKGRKQRASRPRNPRRRTVEKRPTMEKRPQGLQRSDTVHSRYVDMFLQQDEIPRWHTISASVSVWLLLAGFLVFPGTFTNIQESFDGTETEGIPGEAARRIVNAVANIPLLVVGAVACGIAATGMVVLYIRHSSNYIWICQRLFLPGLANSLAGLISTLTAVYASKDGNWSITARVTGIVESCYFVACAILFIVYEVILMRGVKKRHGTHYQDWQPGANGESKTNPQRTDPKSEEAMMEPSHAV